MTNKIRLYKVFPSEVIDGDKPYILWLASWYPSKTMPYNGDFIQRHAYAAAIYLNILVVHTIHDPKATDDIIYEVREQPNLKEIIIYFRDNGDTSTIWGKLRYNFRFYQAIRNFISVLFLHRSLPRIVHVHVPMKMGKVALWIKEKWKIPFLLSEHSASYLPTAPDYFFKRSGFYQKNVQRIFAQAFIVTNVSDTISQILQKIFTIRQITIIRNVADEKLFFYSPKLEGNFRFIHVSTMNHQKNFDGLINVFEKLYSRNNEVELLLVGPMSSAASERLDRSPAKHAVMCTGEINYGEVARFMQEANCFVLFSRYENFPCVIVEALCCGLPVISSDAGGAAEGINDRNGIVVPTENEAALLTAMNKMISEYANYHRPSIAEDAKSKYSYQTIGRKFGQLYLASGLG